VRLLNKPEYLFRPWQVLARIRFAWKREDEAFDVPPPGYSIICKHCGEIV
jgi:hypothetical protein